MFRIIKLCFLLFLLVPGRSHGFADSSDNLQTNSQSDVFNRRSASINDTVSEEEANLILKEAKSEKKLEHFKSAIEKYNHALSIFKKINDIENILEVYSGLADCYKKTEEIKKCNDVARLQYELAKAHNEYKYVAIACLTLSWANVNDAEKSMAYLIEAKENAEKIIDPALMTRVNLTFAGNYMELGKFDQAIQIINEGIPTVELSKDTALLFSAYNILGITYRRSGKYQQCGEALEKAAFYARASGSTVNEAMAENNLIRLYKYNLPDTAKMFLHYYRAKALAIAMNNANMESRIDSYIAQYYFETEDYDKCILLSNEIMNRSAKFKDYSMTSSMNDLLYQVYEKKGDYKQALKYHVQFKADFDSLSNVERSNKAKELLTKYETEKKEKELAILNKEKAERELKLISQQNELTQSVLINKQQAQELEISTLTLSKTNTDLEKKKLEIANAKNALRVKEQERLLQLSVISRQRNQQFMIIGFGLTLLLIGFLLFHRYKLVKKLETQQALLNERKRISSELHDDLGAQLSTARMFLNHMKENSSIENDQELIVNSLQMIESSISDLRKIMDDLQSSTLEEKGYLAATEELVNKINLLQKINFTLSHHQIHSRLEKKTEHQLFRITQELINNTLRYAQAKNVSIELVKRDNKIVLLYEDNGVGMDLKRINRGRGLSNIENRIQSLNGNVNFDTAPGTGFRVVIEIPEYAREEI